MAETTEEKNPKAAGAEGEEAKRFQTTVEKIGPCRMRVAVTAPPETVRDEQETRFREIVRSVALPGFRVGHAPRKLVERRFGEDVAKEVASHLVEEGFRAAIEEHDLEPIGEPELDLPEEMKAEEGKSLEFSGVFLVRPEVPLPDYSSITAKRVKEKWSEEQVDELIESLRSERSVLEPAPEGEAFQENGSAVLQVKVHAGDELLLEEENVEYHHPSQFAAGFRLRGLKDAILGKKADDEFTVEDRVPDAWPDAALRGRDLKFTARVLDVKRRVLPEVDEAFVKALDYDSVEEFRDEVRSRVKARAAATAEAEQKRAILDAVLAAAPFELPQDVVDQEIEKRVKRAELLLKIRGVADEEFEEEMAKMRSSEAAEVEREFRVQFLVDRIAKHEKIFVTESEMSDRIDRIAQQNGRPRDAVLAYMEEHEMLPGLRAEIREEKVFAMLSEKVRIEE